MKVRFICICSAVALAAAVASGAGNYQRTKDGKTTVWNGDPKPGDVAQWFGGRDDDGYATGVGTLIWFTRHGQLYARYHGKMVRGKLDGAVDASAKGRTGHAMFADGNRVSEWAPGPASRSADTTAGHTAETAAPSAASVPPPSQPAQPAQTAAKQSPAEPETSVANRISNKNTEAESPNPSSAGQPADSQVAATNHPIPDTGSTSPAGNLEREETDIEDAPAEGPATQKEPQRQSPPEVKSDKPTPEATQPTITIQEKPDVNDFSGPPAALRLDSPAENALASNAAEIASPEADAKLSAEEATALADAEARARGYDPARYQRPVADYSTVKKQWSLFYSSRPGETAGDNPQYFNATVDDATRKVEVKP